tara:strand:- start:550 stop:783 length:234 start_codon:yes stop_codon:yes gene_type:complete
MENTTKTSKNIRFEHKDLLIEKLSKCLNRSEVWGDFETQISFDFPNIKLNADSEIWNEIEEFIINKILEDNNIEVWD